MGHPSKFQRVSRFGSVTARHSSIGRQPNFATLNRGRHLYSAVRPSRWALAHILVLVCYTVTFAAATMATGGILTSPYHAVPTVAYTQCVQPTNCQYTCFVLFDVTYYSYHVTTHQFQLAATLRWFTAGVQSASLYDNFRKHGNYVIMTSLITL